jgi:tRNA 2-thiouridine synthesizing protein A
MKEVIDKFLDTSGLLCPEPVMMLHKAVRELLVGEVIQVVATDPSTQRDIPKFCHFLGHELIKQEEQSASYIYYIKKI